MTSVARALAVLVASSACLSSLGIGCSSNALRPAGTSCSGDGDCAAGLSCLGLATFSDAGCSTTANACSKECHVDGDCAAVGPTFKCFAGCGNVSICGQTP
jgi:hypothetical protein